MLVKGRRDPVARPILDPKREGLPATAGGSGSGGAFPNASAFFHGHGAGSLGMIVFPIDSLLV